MLTLFFFYGLAFIVMSAVIFAAPKRQHYFSCEDKLWMIAMFGLIHGISEWIDLFILNGWPFDPVILRSISAFTLPLSFIFLVSFGSKTIAQKFPKYRYLGFLWVACLAAWVVFSTSIRSPYAQDIAARYFIGLPGTLLTAAALYLAFLESRESGNVPSKTITAGLLAAAVAMAIYGLFAGAIVPKAGFFPASILNYEDFRRSFGLPVQFLRMTVALIISAGFLCAMGYIHRAKGKAGFTGGIKRKFTLMIALGGSVVIILGMCAGYLVWAGMLRNVVGASRVQDARLLGEYICESLSGEIEDAKSYSVRPLWLDAVAESNLKYTRMGKDEIAGYMARMDKSWTSSKSADPLIAEYLSSRISLSMMDILKVRRNLSEIFITDKYGGLVAASGKTSDFYQADESWWQNAYNGGEGATDVSNIEYDESSGFWVIAIAVPMFSKTSEVIGICKYSVSIDRLFSTLNYFKIGSTGRVVVADHSGNVLFGRGLRPMADNINADTILKKLLSQKEGYATVRNSRFCGKEAFVAFYELDPPYLYGKGIKWTVLVMQDAAETYRPLNEMTVCIAVLSALLLMLVFPVGSFFGSLIAGPIHKLHIAAEKIIEGDLDHKIDVKTGDEIEQLADTFNTMISDIKDKRTRLEDFSSDLEEKVAERTRTLKETQEATINILEDLEESKKGLELSNKELKKLDQLKSDFVSTVSHELRTPLSIIKEGVSLVLDKVPGDINEKQNKILDISKFNIDRLARIIDSLLDISKIEAGKVELKRSLIRVSDIARQVATSFEMKAKEKGLELKLDVDRSSGTVYADPDRMAQVVTNLVGNAIKFTASGYVEISCEDKKNLVVCSVKDTGQGISKEDLPKIFNKFQQFGRLAGAGEKGTGLGLSIAKGIMDMHDGSISVQSEYQKGSCFTFSLHKYTEQTLFEEFTESAIKNASQSKSSVSIITVFSKMKDSLLKNSLSASEWQASFTAAMVENAKTVRVTLRRQDDKVVNNGPDILVILVNCTAENCASVKGRIEQTLDKSMEEKKIKDKIDVRYGIATFPDDGKTGMELVNRARARSGAV